MEKSVSRAGRRAVQKEGSDVARGQAGGEAGQGWGRRGVYLELQIYPGPVNSARYSQTLESV